MTTIKDVAQLAGVSITSASYALNGRGTLSTVTRQRILEAAEKLNYHPNAFARNLKNPKTRTIGVFITRFGGSFYEEILEGIHETILETDYELIVCPESRPVHKILTQRQVDGAIIFDSKIQSETLLRLVSKRFPIVVLDRYIEADYVLSLLVNNAQGVQDAFYHLYNQGARKLTFISGVEDSIDNAERKEAFLHEAECNDLLVDCFSGNFTEKSGYDNAQAIIQSGRLPEAVFCANDQMAIGFLKAMQECHLQAPRDIAVVGFDDIPIAQYFHPSLSTIQASRLTWGSSAVVQLIDYLENGNPFRQHRIPTRFIPRESSSITEAMRQR